MDARERYLRHAMVEWFDQEYVRGLDVIVVGTGAVGNEVAKNLCLLGMGRLHLVDFDSVEPHNLPKAVLFRETDVGRGKAEVAAARCARLDPNVAVTHAHGDLWEVLGFERLRRASAVVCCVDSLEARLRLSSLCQLAQVPLVNTAIDARSVVVEHYPFRTAPRCACYACALPASAHSRLRSRYSCGWLRKRAIEEHKIPTTIITSAFAGAFAAAEVLQRLAQSNAVSRRVFLDTRTLAMSQVELAPDPQCPACASRPTHVAFIKAPRSAQLALGRAAPPDAPAEITFGEPIVLGAACQSCGASVALNEPAHRHDETLAHCPDCRQQSRQVSIVERMALAEFLDRFGCVPVPGKFLRVDLEDHSVIIELE